MYVSPDKYYLLNYFSRIVDDTSNTRSRRRISLRGFQCIIKQLYTKNVIQLNSNTITYQAIICTLLYVFLIKYSHLIEISEEYSIGEFVIIVLEKEVYIIK